MKTPPRNLRPARPAQHSALALRPTIAPHGECIDLLINDAESPLAWLHRRKDRDGTPLVDHDGFAAGERLRADYTRGGLIDGLTSNWRDRERVSGGGARRDLSDSAIAARRRVEEALAAVGPELSGVLIDVCCFLKGLEQVETERRWPARSAKVVLKLALSRLAAHYRPVTEARGRSHSAAIGVWSAEP
jgi:hypothetical protein